MPMITKGIKGIFVIKESKNTGRNVENRTTGDIGYKWLMLTECDGRDLRSWVIERKLSGRFHKGKAFQEKSRRKKLSIWIYKC